MHVTAGVSVTHAALYVRDDRWLAHVLERIWAQYFPDTPHANVVRVGFGAPWKGRLGVITMTEDQAFTDIYVNALLRWFEVPECVTSVTVAHEMVHYAHGFGSPMPRRYKHPHRGGIVTRELLRRGMKHEYQQYDEWVYHHWYDFYAVRLESAQQPFEAMQPDQVASELTAE